MGAPTSALKRRRIVRRPYGTACMGGLGSRGFTPGWRHAAPAGLVRVWQRCICIWSCRKRLREVIDGQ